MQQATGKRKGCETLMKTKRLNVRNIFDKYSIYLVLLIMLIFMGIISDDFFTTTNFINVLVAEAGRGLLVLGECYVIISKGIDLSVGSIVALSSVTSASIVQDITYDSRILQWMPEINPILGAALAVVVGVVIGLLFGLFNGLLVAYTKTPPFIATLGSMVIAAGLALMYTDSFPVSMLSSEFKNIGQGKVGVIPYVVIVFIVIAVIAWVILNKTRFGKSIYAIGGNESAAQYAGINVKKNTCLIYIWAGVLAGLAGVLITARSGSGIATLGDGYELDAIAAATVGGVSQTGGVGTIGGAVVGIFILGVLNNGLLLLGVSPYLQQVIKGLIIIGAVVVDMRKAMKNN